MWVCTGNYDAQSDETQCASCVNVLNRWHLGSTYSWRRSGSSSDFALYIPHLLNHLENVVEKVSAVSRASHRPRNTVGGAHIQPRGDTVEDGSEGEGEVSCDEDDVDCSDDEDLTCL